MNDDKCIAVAVLTFSQRNRYEIFETADFPLKLIPATLLCLIGAFLDFLSGRKLKVCSMNSDFKKIERKK